MVRTFKSKSRFILNFIALFVSISAIGQDETNTINTDTESIVSSNWKQAGINTIDNNTIEGVNVFFKNVECRSQNLVLLKFVNTNDVDVLIEWKHGIIISDREYIHDEHYNLVRQLNLTAKSEIEGDCRSTLTRSLLFKLDQYLDDPELPFRYYPTYIQVTKKN